MEQKELSLFCRLPLQGLCLTLFLIMGLLGLSPIPLAAQEGYAPYAPYQTYQKPGESTTTTKEEKVGPDGTKTTKETTSTESQGSRYRFSGLPGKFIKSGGQSRGQGQLSSDLERHRRYCFDFGSQGLPKGTDPTEAYWFERQDGKLMLIDPRITQSHSGNPR